MHFDELEEALQLRKDIDLPKVKRAYHLAEKAHWGQKRKSGEDYITHPLAVVKRLVDLGADEETIISALLHDTVEDTDLSLTDIEQQFGSSVAKLVEGMTKFKKHSFAGRSGMDEKIETIRKWLGVMQEDLRISIIKLTDRLDNLTTLHVFENPEKRKRIAEETLDVYSKIAEWLSLNTLKYELEDLALPYALDDESYQKFKLHQSDYQQRAAKLCRKVHKAYATKHPRSEVVFKPHPVSPLRFSLNPDIPCEIICLAPTKADCYQMLSFFHGHWRQKYGSFTDFINTPRVNGYQALHTTIVFDDAQELTVHIMTEKMYQYSQQGVLTYCFSGVPMPPLPWIEKLSELLDTNQEKSLEFWRGIHSDLFEGFILVHGPQGKVVSLPRRSTYLDAAFEFLKTEAIYVDKILAHGEEIPIRRKIEEGETIDFVLAESSQVVYDWLDAVDNVSSIKIIKDALRQQNDAEKIEIGRRLLQQEFDKYNLGFVDEIKEKTLLLACQDLEITSLNDLLIKIGEVLIFPSEVSLRLARAKSIKNNNADDVSAYVLECAVRRDRFSDFFNHVELLFSKVSIRLLQGRQRTYVVKIDVRETKEKIFHLVSILRREPGMKALSVEKKIDIPFVAGLIFCIVLLWGIEPVIVYRAYQQQLLIPEDMLLLRSLIIALPLLAWSFFSTKKMKQNPLPIFNKLILMGATGVFVMLYFRYHLLIDTDPAQYMIMYRNHAYLVMLFFMPFALLKKNPLLTGLFLACCLGGNYLLLFLTPEWPWQYKIFNILAFIGLGIYTITSQIFAEKYHVKIRYYQFIAIIYFYCSVFAAINYYVSVEAPFERIAVLFGDQLLLISFLSFAALIPHILVYHLNLHYKNSLYTQAPVALTWVVTLILEGFILGIPLNAITISGGVLVTTGIFALLLIQRSKERLDVPF